ncbi:hypothetical protein CBP52_13405 [Cellulomonas sp. PSBB021]|nr:hypothetical protein CBP52_13405 [Cellulomonas sp. PSBB021]
MEVAFRYAGRSGLRVDRTGAHLGLATGERRTFVDGSAQRADVVAAALLLVARVAASRFDEPAAQPGPGVHTGAGRTSRDDRTAHGDLADLVEHADPFLTTGDGLVRFESLAACGGVAARLDLLPAGLDVTPRAPGTTTVDLGPRVRELLAGLLPRDPLRVSASAAGLEERSIVGRVQERRVVLADRWVRSLTALPVLASTMQPRARLSARHARAFVRGVPADGTAWLLPARDGLRTLPAPAGDAFRLDGAWRLRVLEPLVRHATGLRVHEHRPTGTTWWELELPHARLGLALSAHPGRAFADETLTQAPSVADEERAADERATGQQAADQRAADQQAADQRAAAAAGRLAYDLADGRWFERTIPFARDLLTPDDQAPPEDQTPPEGKGTPDAPPRLDEHGALAPRGRLLG